MAICPHCETQTEEAYVSCPTGDGYYTIEENDFHAYRGEPLLGWAVGGRFIVSSLLGEGSMARVFKARQTQVDRDVALKLFDSYKVSGVMSSDDLKEAASLAQHRFEQEAKVLGKLSHPNCVTLYDFGVAERDHFLYIAMEHVSGVSLRTAINRGLKYDAIIEIIQQMLLALREAHALEIVHRDLKPENIILSMRFSTEEPVVKVVDFGIAKMLNLDSLSRTKTGTLFGTPAYMSPEQCKGETDRVGPHSDVYAIGCILFEMLTGSLPYPASTPQEMLRMHIQDPVPQVRPRAKMKVPDAVKAFVMTCMAKNPAERYPDGQQALIAFRKAIDPELRRGHSTSEIMIERALHVPNAKAGKVVVPKNNIRGDAIAPPVVAPKPTESSQARIEVHSEALASGATDTHPEGSLELESEGRSKPQTFLLALFGLLAVVGFIVVLFYYIFTAIVGGG